MPPRNFGIALAVIIGVLTGAVHLHAADKVGEKIAPTTVLDLDGTPALLGPAEKAKATAVVFLSFDCPVSNAAAATLAELAKEYAGRGLSVVGVVSTDDLPAAVKKRAAEFALPFPVVIDPKLASAGSFAATATPEAFVLDAGGVLRYRGRIDDAYSARLKKNPKVTSRDLRDAVAAVLDGKPVPTASTTPVGCPIIYPSPAPAVPAAVTYHRDVAPILQAHCQGCHRPGQVGPFALTTYKHAATWAADIKAYTRSRAMPPWKPTAGVPFNNERRLTDAQIETLAKWADAGSPEGDPADGPKPAAYPDEWAGGKPDLILTPSEDFHVGPTGGDLFRCFVIPTGLTEDKYVVAYEVRPGAPAVVHHTLNYYDLTGKGRELAAKEEKQLKLPNSPDRGPGYPVGMGVGFIPPLEPLTPGGPRPVDGFGGWAPGQLPAVLPPGTGFLLPKGSDVILQVHYHRTGKPEKDRTRLGLYFAPKPVEKVFQTITVGGMSPLTIIPAGKKEYAAKGSRWLLHDAVIHSVLPHMHLLGRKIKVTLTPPGGTATTLVEITDWDYNWQETYWFRKPITAPAGSRIDVEAVYDNSAANPNNPSSPPRMVLFGEETTNEMLYAFLGATPVGPSRVRTSRTPPEK